MQNMINLGINEDMVKPILQKQIEAAVLARLGNTEELIRKTVSFALNEKVDKNGNVSTYRSDNSYDFLELLVGKAIREAAEESLRDWLKDNVQIVKAMVTKEMNNPERQGTLIKSFADTVEEALRYSWNFRCDVRFDKKED